MMWTLGTISRTTLAPLLVVALLDVYLKRHGVVPNEMYELRLQVAVLDRQAGRSKVTFGGDMDSVEFIGFDYADTIV